MCLYPKLMRNPRYKGAKEVLCTDKRMLYVTTGCGECYECRKQKAQQWRVRLCEELKVNAKAYFVTLTFSPEALSALTSETGKGECNGIATIAVRRFLERYRKANKHSLRHWLITEMGHENTERIHLHGIIFDTEEWDKTKLESYWKYGRCDTGKYCNIRSINYIVKYVTKIDQDHKNFKPVILASPGLGAAFCKTLAAKNTYVYKPGKSAEFYTLPNGRKVALPLYYRNKLYTEAEREKLWSDRLDKKTIFVNGIKIRNIDTPEGYDAYIKILQEQQAWNKAIGYGDRSEEWRKEEYNITFKMLQKKPNLEN